LIAKQNGRLDKADSLVYNDAEVVSNEELITKQDDSKEESATYITIFKNSFLRKRFLLYTALVVYLYLAYNGILFSVGEVSGGIYVNSLVVSVPELVSYILSSNSFILFKANALFLVFMLTRVKRKKYFLLIMILAAFGGVFLALIPSISNEDIFFLSRAFLDRLMYLVRKITFLSLINFIRQ